MFFVSLIDIEKIVTIKTAGDLSLDSDKLL
jgi:hypothetical protein